MPVFRGIPWAPSPEAELSVWGMALRDQMPQGVADAAYLFGDTGDNELTVLEAGAALMRPKRARGLYICGGGPYRATPETPVAYAGAPAWRSWLVAHGVRKEMIHEIPRTDTLWHTGTEARELITLAKEKDWKTLLIAAPWFRAPRALVNTVSRAVKQGVRVRIYSVVGPSQPFFEMALYSQGERAGERSRLVDGERDRINRVYTNDLDLIPFNKFISYMRWRDNA